MGYSIIGLKLAALILLLICTINLTPLASSGRYEEDTDAGRDLKRQHSKKATILGSKPPECVNKCFSCNPCVAALVAPPNHKAVTEGDESYYLLSWKCMCGNKYYKP